MLPSLPIILIGILYLATPAFAVTTLANPLGTTDIPALLGRIISAGLGIIGSLALLMFIYGGFRWLLSGGDSKAIQAGKDTVVWAVIGLVVVFVAYAAVGFIINALTNGGTSNESSNESAGEEGAICCVSGAMRFDLRNRENCASNAGIWMITGDCDTSTKEEPIWGSEGEEGVCCMGGSSRRPDLDRVNCAAGGGRWSITGECAY